MSKRERRGRRRRVSGARAFTELPHTLQTSSCTLAEVSEGVVALLGEGDLVDGVPQVAVLQQAAGVLPGVPPVLEALHSGEKPVHHVSTCQEQMRIPALRYWTDHTSPVQRKVSHR